MPGPPVERVGRPEEDDLRPTPRPRRGGPGRNPRRPKSEVRASTAARSVRSAWPERSAQVWPSLASAAWMRVRCSCSNGSLPPVSTQRRPSSPWQKGDDLRPASGSQYFSARALPGWTTMKSLLASMPCAARSSPARASAPSAGAGRGRAGSRRVRRGWWAGRACGARRGGRGKGRPCGGERTEVSTTAL